MIKKWQIGDQIHDQNRGELRSHPEASRGTGVTRGGRLVPMGAAQIKCRSSERAHLRTTKRSDERKTLPATVVLAIGAQAGCLTS